jgi:hypothetical protein
MDHVASCRCELCRLSNPDGSFEHLPELPILREQDLNQSQLDDFDSVRISAPDTLQLARSLGMRVADGDGPMCYRSVDSHEHHLAIVNYGICDDGRVRMTVGHGRDSSLPGIGRMGTDPSWLIPCGCGRWQPSTPEQADEARRRLTGNADNDIARAQRRSLTKRRKN